MAWLPERAPRTPVGKSQNGYGVTTIVAVRMAVQMPLQKKTQIAIIVPTIRAISVSRIAIRTIMIIAILREKVSAGR